MICVRLEGGLGNQLFQYAAGRALAKRHGCELVLDACRLRKHARGVTPRELELHHFRHAGRLASAAESRFLPWLHRLPAVSHWLSPWRAYVEKGGGYNPAYALLPDRTYLVGYWQSYRYFCDMADQLVADLTPVAPLSASSMAVARQIDASVSVALHVRRGDYVSLAAATKLHGTLSLAYYTRAMERVSQGADQARYFVFSDDAAWCRTHLSLPDDAVLVTHNTGTDAWQDLMLMARCQHHIIANSSFSWWGAWLADQRLPATPGRIVVAPARWFAGQPEQNLADRFPSHWIAQ